MIVRAAIASALLLTALGPTRRTHRGPAAMPAPCPPSLLARQQQPLVRAAIIASLWAPGRRCVVNAGYAGQEAAPLLLPEARRTQRASGHWARLAEAGYVFAEAQPQAHAIPAPVLRLEQRAA